MKYRIRFYSNNSTYPGLFAESIKDKKILEFNTAAEAEDAIIELQEEIDNAIKKYYSGNVDIIHDSDIYNIIIGAIVSTVLVNGIFVKHYKLEACEVRVRH